MTPVPADFGRGDALLTTLVVVLVVVWLWFVITALIDVLGDDGLSGWAKAAWVFLLVLFPYVTAFVYLIARRLGKTRPQGDSSIDT
jgi:hypothetical protein